MPGLLQRDIDLIRLARELAIDHYEIEEVLDRYKLSYDDWGLLCAFPRFTALLDSEEQTWNSAKNAHQRVRYKAASLIEGYLEEAQKSLHNGNETLVARTGLAKLVASFAGIGEEHKFGVGSLSGGFSITINLGDRTLNVSASGRGPVELPENEVNSDENRVFRPQNEAFAALPPVDIGEDVYAINAALGAVPG